MSEAACERKISLLKASRAFFNEVFCRVSSEVRKWPRGGGRGRDHIVSHTLGPERAMFAKKVGVDTPLGVMLTPDGLRVHREVYVKPLRTYNAEGKMARSWTLAFLIRHSAFHVLDHAWEMGDKDLSGES